MTRKMRQFTKHDWDVYGGCESDTPLIGETEVKVILDGYIYSGVIIVDNFFVSIQIFCELDVSGLKIEKLDHEILEKEMAIDKECMAKSFTISIAESIPATVDAKWLFLHGFKLC